MRLQVRCQELRRGEVQTKLPTSHGWLQSCASSVTQPAAAFERDASQEVAGGAETFSKQCRSVVFNSGSLPYYFVQTFLDEGHRGCHQVDGEARGRGGQGALAGARGVGDERGRLMGVPNPSSSMSLIRKALYCRLTCKSQAVFPHVDQIHTSSWQAIFKHRIVLLSLDCFRRL